MLTPTAVLLAVVTHDSATLLEDFARVLPAALEGVDAWSLTIVDSGSNELYFPGPAGLPTCSGYNPSNPVPFCPSSTVELNAIQISADHSQDLQILFQITNSTDAVNSGNGAFSDLGASVSAGFVWGLPFFLGHTIWVGINGTSSSLGVGPYWAY